MQPVTATSRGAVLAVAAIAGAGLLLRLPSYGTALFGDEISTFYLVTGHSIGQIIHLLDGHSVETNPPLYYALSWVAERLGSSPELLRLTSLIAGTAAIPLTFLLGLRTVGLRPATAAAALVALSPSLIFYSTEARAYTLVMTLVLASTLVLLIAIEATRPAWWAAYAVLSCVAMYTHYTAIFVLAAQFAWAFIRYPSSRRALIASNVAAAIGFAAWLPVLIKNTHSFGTQVFGILEPFGLHAIGHDVAHFWFGHPYIQLTAVPGTLALALILIGITAGALAAAIGTKRLSLSSPAWLPPVLALATPLGLAIYSTVGRSVWDVRNLTVAWPALALVTGSLLIRAKRPFGLVPAALVVGGFAIAATQMLSPRNHPSDYTAAVRFVLHDGAPRDPIAIVSAPTPGPLSAVDAALAYAGAPGRTILRVGAPPLQEVLHSPPYALLPATPPRTLASQAARVPHGGKLFVIAPGRPPLATLLGAGPVNGRDALGPVFGSGTLGGLLATVYGPLSSFLRAASGQFRALGSRTFPGFLPLSVYVFDRQ